MSRVLRGGIVLLVLVLVGCGEQGWTEAEKKNADYILLAFQEVQQAHRISNAQSPFTTMSPEDLKMMTLHFQNALQYAQLVRDDVLDKVHPEIRERWRNELQEGLELRLVHLLERDNQAGFKGGALMDSFGDWWTANKGDIKIPK
jgi:hypothetical protein